MNDIDPNSSLVDMFNSISRQNPQAFNNNPEEHAIRNDFQTWAMLGTSWTAEKWSQEIQGKYSTTHPQLVSLINASCPLEIIDDLKRILGIEL